MPSAIWVHLATSFIWYRRPSQTAAMSPRRSEQKARAAGKKPSSKSGWAAPGSGK